MIIKLLKQPIIAIDEAKIAGTVDGVIIKGNRLSSICCEKLESRLAVSADKVVFGADAVMIHDITALHLISGNDEPLGAMLEVYNTGGSYLGRIEAIETDQNFIVKYIHTDKLRFDMAALLSWQDVIIADVEENALNDMESPSPEAEADEAVTEGEVSMDIGPDINWDDENVQQEEKAHEVSDLSVVRPMHQTEEKTDTHGIDAKYAYLCGKMLLESIEIDDTLYENGTIIDANLIKHAISSNAIVKVIVNAEE